MRPWSKWILLLSILMIFAGCSSTNWVGREDESPVYRAPRKLARGTVNIISGPFEIFNQPVRLASKEKYFMRQVTGVVAGIPVGLGYGVWRIGAGSFDIITFPILVPQRAIIEPEFMSPDLLRWAFSE